MYTMNRCLLRLALACALSFSLGGYALAQNVQTRIPAMNPKSQAGLMVVTAPPEIKLDGKPARLSPGARIHARNNLQVMSGALVGQALTVRYVRDSLGLVHEVWILTDAEIAALPAVTLAPLERQ
jgi:hypothetical protein